MCEAHFTSIRRHGSFVRLFGVVWIWKPQSCQWFGKAKPVLWSFWSLRDHLRVLEQLPKQGLVWHSPYWAVGTSHPHSFACECCSRTYRSKASLKCTGVASEKYFSGKKNELGRRHPNSQSYDQLCFSLTKKPLTKLHVCSFLLPHAVVQMCNYFLPMRLCSYAPLKLPKSSISQPHHNTLSAVCFAFIFSF